MVATGVNHAYLSFEPDFKEDNFVYQRWTTLDYKTDWGKNVSCKFVGPSKRWETTLEQSHFANAAKPFVDFLTVVIPR